MKRRVALASGRAVAAVLFDKPEGQVTGAEAMAALNYLNTEEDEERRDRALRAGVRASASVLNMGGLLPSELSIPLVAALDALDLGQARGMAKPSPSRRHQNVVERVEFERMLAFQVHFTRGRWEVSKDRALAIVTGVARNSSKIAPTFIGGKPYPTVENPALRMPPGVGFARLKKMLDRGEKELGADKKTAAYKDGVAEREERPLSVHAAFRVKAYTDQWQDAALRAKHWARLRFTKA